jgi:hypothetical protein
MTGTAQLLAKAMTRCRRIKLTIYGSHRAASHAFYQ